MKTWAGGSINFVLALTCLAAKADPPCGDLLQEQGAKPAHLQFVGCTTQEGQIKTQVASYRVSGAHAHAVERYLIRRTGMGPLRFVCCGWQIVPVRRGAPYLGALPGGPEAVGSLAIRMASDETLINTRKDWAKIPHFGVQVMRYLEEP